MKTFELTAVVLTLPGRCLFRTAFYAATQSEAKRPRAKRKFGGHLGSFLETTFNAAPSVLSASRGDSSTSALRASLGVTLVDGASS
jgi:hypothetical protein